jgi:small subunit ribosomal protein S7
MRRRKAEIREIASDLKYGSIDLARFINRVMLNGKKTVAQGIVYSALDIIEGQSGRSSVDVFSEAVRNSTPQLQVKARRVGGTTYQVPIEVTPRRGLALGMTWLIIAARKRKGAPMRERLAQELLDASRGEGAAVKRREDMHRMADANRAFVHYRW